jgi:hypothetical protein
MAGITVIGAGTTVTTGAGAIVTGTTVIGEVSR